jgi:hypothetical protein
MDEVRIPAMGFILVLCLALALGLIVFRDRSSLMANENERITSILIGFAILIPFAATDFLDNRYDQIIGMGAIGLLSLTLAMIRGVSGSPRLLGFLYELMAAVGISLVLLGLVKLLFDASPRQEFELWVGLLAFAVALMCSSHLQKLIRDRSTLSLSAAIAHARTGSIHNFLSDLQQHRLLKSSRLVEGTELEEKVPPEVLKLLQTTPVVSRGVLEEMQAQGNMTADRGAALSMLTAYQLTHAVDFGATPPRVLLCETTMLGSDRAEEDDLLLLSQLAKLIQGNNSHG